MNSYEAYTSLESELKQLQGGKLTAKQSQKLDIIENDLYLLKVLLSVIKPTDELIARIETDFDYELLKKRMEKEDDK